MATWNWPWRHTMRVRGLLIGLTASLRSGKPGTTCKRYRMRIFGLDRVVLRARFQVHAQSTEKSIPPDASSSRTIEPRPTEPGRFAAGGQGYRLASPFIESPQGLPFFHYTDVVCKNVGRACWGSEKF